MVVRLSALSTVRWLHSCLALPILQNALEGGKKKKGEEEKSLIFNQALPTVDTVRTSTYKAKVFVIIPNGFSWQTT